MGRGRGRGRVMGRGRGGVVGRGRGRGGVSCPLVDADGPEASASRGSVARAQGGVGCTTLVTLDRALEFVGGSAEALIVALHRRKYEWNTREAGIDTMRHLPKSHRLLWKRHTGYCSGWCGGKVDLQTICCAHSLSAMPPSVTLSRHGRGNVLKKISVRA